MPPTVRVQTNAKEPIAIIVVGRDGAPLTGLSNVKLQVRRMSDGLFLDWADNIFKVGVAVTTLLRVLTEVNATYNPGVYELDTAPHGGGFDLSELPNKVASDTYQFTAIQDGTPQTAGNMPQAGEIKEGGYVDNVDLALSSLNDLSAAEVDAELTSAHGAGSWTSVAGTVVTTIKQSYAYNPATGSLVGQVWLERDGIVVATPTSVSATWYDEDGAPLFMIVDAAPDAQGFFKVSQLAPGFSTNASYYVIATVVDSLGTFTSGKGVMTIG